MSCFARAISAYHWPTGNPHAAPTINSPITAAVSITHSYRIHQPELSSHDHNGNATRPNPARYPPNAHYRNHRNPDTDQ
jgi:hypothetical protein